MSNVQGYLLVHYGEGEQFHLIVFSILHIIQVGRDEPVGNTRTFWGMC